MSQQADNHWHLDKKVPIGIIVGFALQTIALIYVGTTWKNAVDHRLTALEKADADTASHRDRIIIIEQHIPRIDASLSEMKAILRELQNQQRAEAP